MIEEKIRDDLVRALKANDKIKISVLRFLIADINNKKIEKADSAGRPGQLTDEELIALIRKQIREHQEAIDLYTRGNRPELVAKEKAETDILNIYLPRQLSLPH